MHSLTQSMEGDPQPANMLEMWVQRTAAHGAAVLAASHTATARHKTAAAGWRGQIQHSTPHGNMHRMHGQECSPATLHCVIHKIQPSHGR
jgi:hypothetical protein